MARSGAADALAIRGSDRSTSLPGCAASAVGTAALHDVFATI
ncbi:hypothetical protein [Amycolatopsis sp. NPDC004772]